VNETKPEAKAMGYNHCRKCGLSSRAPGSGRIADPARKWWQFWRTVECDACGGDGYAKPHGWPDKEAMQRLKPTPPPPPPPKRYSREVGPDLGLVSEIEELLKEPNENP
jgi:hypothetical protein